jgi:small-conductance mechanosensitive channel
MSDFNWAPVMSWFMDDGIRICIILAVGVLLWFFLRRFIRPLLYHAVKRTKGETREGIRKRTDTLTSVFVSTGKILIALIVILMILEELDVPIAPALATLGVAGVAVGFGAQYMIRDLIAGVFIIWENQYRVDDVVKVADIVGLVEEVNMRKTVLRDLDGRVHHVPNGEIKVASNYSRHFARINLNISVAYGTDLDHAISVINRVGRELAKDKEWRERIMSVPEVLRVNKLGDSGIDIKILGEVKPMEQWSVAGELRLRLKKAFDEEGIEIPWPHVKVYFGEMPADKGLVCKACSKVNLPGSKFCSHCGAKLGK